MAALEASLVLYEGEKGVGVDFLLDWILGNEFFIYQSMFFEVQFLRKVHKTAIFRESALVILSKSLYDNSQNWRRFVKENLLYSCGFELFADILAVVACVVIFILKQDFIAKMVLN